MDFKQLQSFVAVVKLRSFSKAAESLYLTQPTISGHIQALEQELGTVLINRNSNKQVSPTRAGEILFQYAVDILNKRENALFSLSKFKGKIEGILEISASTIPEQYFLPDILSKFNKKYPDVQYNLMKYDSQEVIDKILSGEIDFGFVGFKKELNQLDYIEITEDSIVLIAPDQGKYSNMDTIPASFLAGEKFIMREKGSGTRKVLEKALAKHNIPLDSLNVVAFIENTQTIKECVRKGLGLTFISEKAVAEELAGKVFKILNIEGLEIRRQFYFVYHKTRVLSPLAQTFKEFVLEHKLLKD
ncbi:MAG: LysR family transcriptional regulator [Thermoanaerobacteraceae bacterium]|nr:LysR family transcriptional regulator [Thermoanaerobacteraceae bacterium]